MKSRERHARTFNVAKEDVVATDRTFQLSTPLINSEADRTLAATRSENAQAILVIATRNEITAAGMETVLHAAGYRVAGALLMRR
jgi:two-component system nitrate/nitrite response regulator NarL